MNNDYMTIKEFAEAVGISQQAVYKHLNNKLKPYLKMVDSKKMLNKSALELFKKQENHSTVDSTNDQLLNEINQLKNQLKDKEKQIEELQADKEFLKKSLYQEQQLHAKNIQRLDQLEAKFLLVSPEDSNDVIEDPKPQEGFWKRLFKGLH